MHVRRDDEEPIKELLAQFPNVDLTGIRSASDHGAVVELIYTDQANRVEQRIGFMDPITPAERRSPDMASKWGREWSSPTDPSSGWPRAGGADLTSGAGEQ